MGDVQNSGQTPVRDLKGQEKSTELGQINGDYVFQAYLKEAEFLRSEALQCIDVVRRITVFATSIAGAALPILAGLITPKDGTLTITTFDQFLKAISANHLLVQFVCLGVSLTSFALLRIYLGSFLQIFNFARYFREYLVPALNDHIGAGQHAQVMHWENWLKANRNASKLNVGDADLAAEPILMSLYCILYAAMFAVVGYYSNTFPATSIIISLVIFLLVGLTISKFRNVLADAAGG